MNKNDPLFDLECFPAGSVIWVKCHKNTNIQEMSKAIEELELSEFTFIVTGPQAMLELLPSKVLRQALTEAESLEKTEKMGHH